MSEEDNNNLRSVPQSSIDLNFFLTNSVWGTEEVNPDLKKLLEKNTLQRDEKGKPIYIQDKDGNLIPIGNTSSIWSRFGMFTRDMRLGNLSEFDGELASCRYHIKLASVLLACDMFEPFQVCLTESATILETSQSKKGFLRQKMNTFRQEHIQQNLEPPKKSLFGLGKKEGGNY